MTYEFNVKDNNVLFSNDVVKDLKVFQLEFVTDAPKLCRLLRKEINDIYDPFGIIHSATDKQIRTYFDGFDTPTNFRIRFSHPFTPANDVALQVTIKEW
jgi:hypothetical protein